MGSKLPYHLYFYYIYLTSQLILTSLLKPSVTNGTEGMSTEISERLEITLKSNSTRMVPTNELTRDIFRLLDVDTRIVVPFNIHVRINLLRRCFTCMNCAFVRGES